MASLSHGNNLFYPYFHFFLFSVFSAHTLPISLFLCVCLSCLLSPLYDLTSMVTITSTLQKTAENSPSPTSTSKLSKNTAPPVVFTSPSAPTPNPRTAFIVSLYENAFSIELRHAASLVIPYNEDSLPILEDLVRLRLPAALLDIIDVCPLPWTLQFDEFIPRYIHCTYKHKALSPSLSIYLSIYLSI